MLDSFTLLEQLRMESPQHFATLARVPATFQNTAYSQRYVNLDRDDVYVKHHDHLASIAQGRKSGTATRS